MQNEQLNKLKEFVEMNDYDIIYDSDQMPFGRVFFQTAIVGRRNVAILLEDSKGNVFGTFVSETVPQIPDGSGQSDLKQKSSFIFSLNSEQLNAPKKWFKDVDHSDYLSKQFDYGGENTLLIRGLSETSEYVFSIAQSFGILGNALNQNSSGYLYFNLSQWYCGSPTHEQLIGEIQLKQSTNTYFGVKRVIIVQFYNKITV